MQMQMSTSKRLLVVSFGVMLWIGWPGSVAGQTPCTQAGSVYTCETGQARTASFDKADDLADYYYLRINGASVGPQLPHDDAVVTYSVTFGDTLPAGSYQVDAVAVNSAGQTASAPVTLVLEDPPVPPSAPTGLHIVEVIIRERDVAGTVLREHRVALQVQPEAVTQ